MVIAQQTAISIVNNWLVESKSSNNAFEDKMIRLWYLVHDIKVFIKFETEERMDYANTFKKLRFLMKIKRMAVGMWLEHHIGFLASSHTQANLRYAQQDWWNWWIKPENDHNDWIMLILALQSTFELSSPHLSFEKVTPFSFKNSMHLVASLSASSFWKNSNGSVGRYLYFTPDDGHRWE